MTVRRPHVHAKLFVLVAPNGLLRCPCTRSPVVVFVNFQRRITGLPFRSVDMYQHNSFQTAQKKKEKKKEKKEKNIFIRSKERKMAYGGSTWYVGHSESLGRGSGLSGIALCRHRSNRSHHDEHSHAAMTNGSKGKISRESGKEVLFMPCRL